MLEKFYVTFKAAIWKDDKLFLQKEIRESNGAEIFDLPGGRADKGEFEAHDILRREVKEEIGVELATISDLPIKFWLTEGASNAVAAVLYEATFKNENFNFNTNGVTEVLDVAYLSKEEFAQTNHHVHKQFILELYDQYRSQ